MTHLGMISQLANPSSNFAFSTVLDAPKKPTIIRLRWLAVTVACYLLLFSQKTLIPRDIVHGIALFYVLTNAVLYGVKQSAFESIGLFGTLVVFDTMALSVSLIVTDQLGSDFYLSYFLIIIIAGFWKDLRWSLGFAVLIALLYSYFLFIAEDLTTSLLLRVPFIFIASVFYGYFVQIVNNEHALREKAEKEARQNFLTGLPNRQAYQEIINQETERSRRYGRPLSILMVDIDNFKLVNDTLGHEWGDIVLQKIAYQLRSNLRGLDFVARFGGEEFIVVLPETDLAGALEAAHRLRLAVRQNPIETAQGLLTVTVSIGVSSNLITDCTDHKRMTLDADEALYQAKRAGKDRVETLSALNRIGPLHLAADHGN
ncbi:MAG: GGDEF domain-containing protein [Chloroflexota bacterium]